MFMIPGKMIMQSFFSCNKIFIDFSHAFGDIENIHFETDADLPITAIVTLFNFHFNGL